MVASQREGAREPERTAAVNRWPIASSGDPARGERQGVLAIVALFALMIVAGIGYENTFGDASSPRPDEPPGVNVFDYESVAHRSGPIAYAESPPVGGDHASVWQTCGVYAAAVAPEQAVHSLEHGAVWIAYQPTLDAASIDRLRAIAARNPYVIVSPYPGLTVPVAISAWNHQLLLGSTADPRLDRFVTMFQQGPETPEKGAPCSGGSSETFAGAPRSTASARA